MKPTETTYRNFLSRAFLLLTGLLCVVSLSAQTLSKAPVKTDKFDVSGCDARVFIENKGQVWDYDRQPRPEVRFAVENKGMQLFLMETGIAYQFTKTHYPEGYLEAIQHKTGAETDFERTAELEKQIRTETFRMNMELEGANPHARISKENKSPNYIHYYNRNVLDIHSYSKVTYHNIYEGIDWVLYTQGNDLKYDFVVQAGADPSQIRLKFTHHENLTLNTDGSLTLSNRMGSISEKAPVSFQGDNQIATQFVLEDNLLTFRLGEYERSQPLIIDPVLQWATYYGGTGADDGYSVSTDKEDNVYLLGSANSTNNISFNGYQNTYGGGTFDAFLVKFNSNGIRQWATYYGGETIDYGYSCATDNFGNVYLAGVTQSKNGIASGGHQNTLIGNRNGFLVKFDSDGIRQWATYYGGGTFTVIYSCATDRSGNVYVAGDTYARADISFKGHQNNHGGGDRDAFLVKFNSNGIRQWATYYGGEANDFGSSVCTDKEGNIYLSGTTSSTTNIAFNGHQNTYGGDNSDAFLVKFNADGVRQWATYYEGGHSCATDSFGNVYLTGSTPSTTGVSFNGHQNNYGGGSFDAFLVKFNTDGMRQWATYYGGEEMERGRFVTTDKEGNIYLSGITSSTTNIAFNGHQNTYGGGNSDAFLVKFNTDGVRQWATYYGGSESDEGRSCATDNFGNVYLSGTTRSTNNIFFDGHQNNLGGANDAFLAKFFTCVLYDTTLTDTACNTYTWGANNITYIESGTYSAFILKDSGCDSFVTLNLTILKSFSNILFAEACGHYTWSVNNKTYTQSGTYKEVFVAQNGCDSVYTLVLTIDNLPSEISLSATPQQGCEPLRVTFDIGSMSAYVNVFALYTGNGDSVELSEIGQAAYTYTSHGSYTPQLRVRTQSGCDTLLFGEDIEVFPRPVAAFSFLPQTPDLDNPYVSFQNHSTGAISYLWHISPFGEFTDFEPQVTYEDSGFYPARLITENDLGCSDTAEGMVYIRPNYRVFVPNAFSPNGDGRNDTFKPAIRGFSDLDFKIYNRWGELVFHSRSDEAWDGTYQGAEAPQGIYMFTLQVINLDGETQRFTGTVHLLR